jgi:hypothetical protein
MARRDGFAKAQARVNARAQRPRRRKEVKRTRQNAPVEGRPVQAVLEDDLASR